MRYIFIIILSIMLCFKTWQAHCDFIDPSVREAYIYALEIQPSIKHPNNRDDDNYYVWIQDVSKGKHWWQNSVNTCIDWPDIPKYYSLKIGEKVSYSCANWH